MRRIKVVQIGMGHDHAPGIMDSLLALPEIFEVAGFAVPESEQGISQSLIIHYRDEMKIPYMTVEEAFSLQELDGAVIETEEKNLTQYALMAAQKGLSVHMDKPGGIDKAGFHELVQELKDRRLVFSIGYMYRFNPVIMQAIEKAEQGELGEIYSVEAHMDCEHVKEKRQWLGQFPGGMMFFLGCHLVDLVHRIQGMPLEVLPYNTTSGYEGVTAQDVGMALFRYPNGISFVKTSAAEPGGFMRRQLVICGTQGTIELKPLETAFPELYSKRLDTYTDMCFTKTGTPWRTDGERTRSELFNRYDSMMTNFAQMVCGEKENPYTYEYELEQYDLLLQACGAK